MRYLLLLLFACLQLHGQNMIRVNNTEINGIDSEGKKVGFWKLYDVKRNITASGTVADNSKFAEVSYFVDNKIFATQKQDSIIIFYVDGQRIKTKLSWRDRRNPIIKDNGEPLEKVLQTKFFKISEMPVMYYGGEPALERYLNKKIGMAGNGLMGRVVVSVVIDIDGKVANATIKSSDNHKLNSDALWLVENMPRWQPGLQSGTFVRTQIDIPIFFGM